MTSFKKHSFVIMLTLSSLVATEVVVVTTGDSLDKKQNDIFKVRWYPMYMEENGMFSLLRILVTHLV